jgi:hypothetical protein
MAVWCGRKHLGSIRSFWTNPVVDWTIRYPTLPIKSGPNFENLEEVKQLVLRFYVVLRFLVCDCIGTVDIEVFCCLELRFRADHSTRRDRNVWLCLKAKWCRQVGSPHRSSDLKTFFFLMKQFLQMYTTHALSLLTFDLIVVLIFQTCIAGTRIYLQEFGASPKVWRDFKSGAGAMSLSWAELVSIWGRNHRFPRKLIAIRVIIFYLFSAEGVKPPICGAETHL